MMPQVEVRADDVHRFLVAASAFRPGDPILVVDGDLVRHPSRYSLQVADDLHVDVPRAVAADDTRVAALYPWRFLNHSCAPNAVLRERTLVALRPIAAGDEITFDYDTTEYEMAEPFSCRCGACGGRVIGGFARLSQAERMRRRPLLAAHLERRLADAGVR